MPLSDATIRALKPRDKDYRVADEKGRYRKSLAASDPTRDLRGALTRHKSKHHAAILEPKKSGELLRDRWL